MEKICRITRGSKKNEAIGNGFPIVIRGGIEAKF